MYGLITAFLFTLDYQNHYHNPCSACQKLDLNLHIKSIFTTALH